MLRQDIATIGKAGDRPAIDGGDDIPYLGAVVIQTAILLEGRDAQPRRNAVVGRFAGGDQLRHNAQLRPSGDPSVLHQIIQNGQRVIDGDGKADPLVAFLHQLAGGDADHLPVRIDERAAAVAGVDGHIRLDADHGVAQFGGNGAPDGGDIAHRLGGGQRQPRRVADGHDYFAHFQLIAVAEGGRHQPLRNILDPQQCQVGLIIRPHQGGRVAVAVLQHDLACFHTADDMGVGDDIPLLREDDAAAHRGGAAAVADDAYHRSRALFVDADRRQPSVLRLLRQVFLRLVLLVDLRQMLQLLIDSRRLRRGLPALQHRHADAEQAAQQDHGAQQRQEHP